VGNVENLSRERVRFVVSDIVVNHQNDLVSRDSVLERDLVGVVSISLVAIVLISHGASNDDSPVVLHGGSSLHGQNSSRDKSCSHSK